MSSFGEFEFGKAKSYSVDAVFGKIRNFLPLAVVVFLLCGLVYLAVQQSIRSGANDPQIQMSEDAAGQLAQGVKVEKIVTGSQVDLAKSLAPFLIVYDSSGKVLASGAVLDGVTPVIPQGVLAAAKINGQNRLTWQPKDGVRMAIVVTSFQGTTSGFVLSGRSLREVEVREDKVFMESVLAGIVSLLAAFFVSIIVLKNPR